MSPIQIKLFYCNIRSYQRNKIAVDMLVNHGKYDLIILTETWLEKDKSVGLTSSEYAFIDEFSLKEKRGGGIRIIYKRKYLLFK